MNLDHFLQVNGCGKLGRAVVEEALVACLNLVTFSLTSPQIG